MSNSEVFQMEAPDVLHLPRQAHRTSQITRTSNFTFKMIGSHKVRVPYSEFCEPALKRLGLYQVAQLADSTTRIDRALITALVERWRPETHTFHLPIGEMTVTLQDVSCIWGLPIQGMPVTGISDDDWSAEIENLLGIDPAYDWDNPEDGPWRIRKQDNAETGESDVTFSRYHIYLAWLRQNVTPLSNNPTEVEIERYTRFYCMDLFGSILFPDQSGDSVPAKYLQFLGNLVNVPTYNWGGAVLSFLYRELCRGCLLKTKSICGPMLLLQMWSWTYFTVGRPKPTVEPPPFGDLDLSSRHAYGIKWCTRHCFSDNHRGSVASYRDQFQRLDEEFVNWMPYIQFLGLAPPRVMADSVVWLCRVPLILFWMVEYHYPDRVMRQFGLYQVVPPPALESWDLHQNLHRCAHSASSWLIDWDQRHEFHIGLWNNLGVRHVYENRPFDSNMLHFYYGWFRSNCMHIVIPQSELGSLDVTVAQHHVNVGDHAYVPHVQSFARLIARQIKHATYDIQCVLRRGTHAVGKITLHMCRGNLNDLNQSHLMPYMLAQAGLPTNVDDILVDDDVPPQVPPEPRSPEFNEDVMNLCDEMLTRGDYAGFADMITSQITQVTPPPFPHDHEAGTSQVPPRRDLPPRDQIPPSRWSPSGPRRHRRA